jgi:hypothetical protein
MGREAVGHFFWSIFLLSLDLTDENYFFYPLASMMAGLL